MVHNNNNNRSNNNNKNNKKTNNDMIGGLSVDLCIDDSQLNEIVVWTQSLHFKKIWSKNTLKDTYVGSRNPRAIYHYAVQLGLQIES